MKRARSIFDRQRNLKLTSVLDEALEAGALQAQMSASEYFRNALRYQLRRDHVPIVEHNDKGAA